MKRLLITVIILATQFVGYTQESATKTIKPRPFNITIKETSGKTLRGILSKATPDSLYVTLNNMPSNSFYQLSPEQLEKLTLRRKGVMGKSILIGTAVGMITGVIVALSEGDDPLDEFYLGMNTGEKVAAYGLGLGGAGAVVGTIVGVAASKKFIIKGKKENYRVHYNDIAQRAMTR
jgi:hypothetical protein